MTISETGNDTVDLGEAARQLEQAAHDAQVAYDSIGLGNLDRAHTYAIRARAAVDSAETWLLTASTDITCPPARRSPVRPQGSPDVP